jgi:uncharacterized protein (TIGR01319 family)
MTGTGILIDFGSTFTKVTVVDLDHGRVIGRAQAPTSVAAGVHHGLALALDRLAETGALTKRGEGGLDLLDGAYVRACSSAAGGLRIAVVGNVPGLTQEAGNAAALGAGAKVVATFGFKLGTKAVSELEAIGPDLVLLTGGMEGGDTATILHNSRQLAASRLTGYFILAGNSSVAEEARAHLAQAGKTVSRADNVMPKAGTFTPESAREEIRRLFMQRITHAAGFEALASVVPVVQATPNAVLKAASLAARGAGDQAGWGDLVLVDVGGATTDVHSIGHGAHTAIDMVPTGLEEPYEKRTVEGDLGIRINAETIVQRAGADGLARQFSELFPTTPVTQKALLDYVQAIARETGRAPDGDWELAVDATLARIASDIAIARHVGRREPYLAREGRIWLQSGKNMTEARTLIGTGGIFAHNRFAGHILAWEPKQSGDVRVLRPLSPRVLIDRTYVMHVVGLLADEHPQVAWRVLNDMLAETRAAGTIPLSTLVDHHGHTHDDCCDEPH